MERSYGIIPCRNNKGAFEFLIVEDFRGNFGFPKGHLELGETPQTAASRELLEETSLKVTEWLPFPPFTMSYLYDEVHPKEVVLFLAKVEGLEKPLEQEIRSIRWVSIDDGAALATFPETKAIFSSLQTLLSSLK